MSQTSYSRVFVNAFAGMLGDSAFKYIQTRVNANSGQLPAGVAVKDTGTDDMADVVGASTDKVSGFIVNSFARDPGSASTSLTGSNAILPNNEMPILSEGTLFVKPENSITHGSDVYVRFASGTGTQLGALRSNRDGVAQVTTVTPTAAATTLYVLRIAFGDASMGGAGNGVWEISTLTPSSGETATTIVTSLKAAIAADAALSALLAASGTATLILTGATAGQAFTVTSLGDGTLSVAATTPPAATCRPLKAARMLHDQGTSGVQLMYFSAAVDAALNH
jgi:hypothetical protein